MKFTAFAAKVLGRRLLSPVLYGIVLYFFVFGRTARQNGSGGTDHGTGSVAMFAGGASGVMCLVGGVLLLKRRLFSPRVRATTTAADILILSLLMVQCALGLLTIPFSAQHMDGSEMMKLVGWAQSVVTFHGGASAHLDGVAFIFRVHLVLGMTLFVLFPFSRLVHIWSAPVEYLTRKYQIVRARR